MDVNRQLNAIRAVVCREKAERENRALIALISIVFMVLNVSIVLCALVIVCGATAAALVHRGVKVLVMVLVMLLLAPKRIMLLPVSSRKRVLGNITVASIILIIGVTGLEGCRQETPPSPAAPQAVQERSVAQKQQFDRGEVLFKQNCAPCHPDGGNVLKPEYSLRGAALRAHSINTPEDIVKIMRKPGPAMIRFDRGAISDQDALAIAHYIVNAFN